MDQKKNSTDKKEMNITLNKKTINENFGTFKKH